LHDGPEPWARRDALLPGLLIAAGVVLLVIGWFGISDAIALNRQMRWLALGITGIIVGGLGMVVWLLFGLTTITRLRRAVYAEIDRRVSLAERAADAPAAATAEARVGFGTVTGMRHYHRADCLMLAGKQASFAAAAEFTEAGLTPCGVCLPADTPAPGGRHA
jgi:hypothetical protein